MTTSVNASPIKVALVGYGYAGRVFHAPLIRATPGLTLHTVVSSRPEAVHADLPDVRVVPDVETVLADRSIGLMVIATPNDLHAPLARRALEAGMAVVVDKPFTVTLAEARALQALSAETGGSLTVFHNRAWDADFLTLQQLIRDRRLGRITRFESHFSRFRPQVRDRWRERPGPGAGIWYDLGPHLADQALRVMGSPVALSADIATVRPGGGADDWFHVVMRFADDSRAILHADMTSTSDLRFVVESDAGGFIKHGLDPQEDALKAGVVPGGPGWGVDPRPGVLTAVDAEGGRAEEIVQGPPGDYLALYRGVRDALSAVSPAPRPPVPLDRAVAVMAVIEAGLLSARERREVVLEE
ncbi:MAG: oxidoreductase [Brevundimonas sp.]|uniref:oxidoreductase n=1 Tax=Brevundimonas sp. TaxID=1871086 RepID=UPI00391B02B2